MSLPHRSVNSSKKVGRAAVAGFCALAMGLSACGGGGSGGADDDALVVGLSYRAASLDPHNGGNYDYQFTGQIFDALVGWDDEGAPGPGLAESWELGPDAQSLVLNLRDGVTFQDGAPLDAEAVKVNLDRARSPESATSSDLRIVENVEVVDPGTVRLDFSAPGAHIVWALAGNAGKMISPATIDNVETAPVGAGPFAFVSSTPDELVLEKFDGYWDAENVKPSALTLRSIGDSSARVRALRSGEISGANMHPSQIEELEAAGLQVFEVPTDQIYRFLINTTAPGLDDPAVRQALFNAVDRVSINENLYGGSCEPLMQPFTEGVGGYSETLDVEPDYDPEAVKAELAAAGFSPGSPLTVELKVPNVSTYQSQAEVLQAQFAAVGIQANVVTVDTAQASADVREGKYQVYVGPTNVETPDPSTFLDTYYVREGTPWSVSLPNGTDLLNEARMTTDPDEQAAPLQQLVIEAQQAGASTVPICAPRGVYGASADMQGFDPSTNGALNYNAVTIN